MESPFDAPRLEGARDAEGWIEERAEYRVLARPKSKFKTVVDAKALFGDGGARLELVTRVREPVTSEVALDLRATMRLPHAVIDDHLTCIWESGLRASKLVRRAEGRDQTIDFVASPFALPRTAYPEVLLPFLMRGQPRDDKRRACYAWTSDLFCARVYYETRGAVRITAPAGTIEAHEVWMYPDLNDWVALGNVLTTLAKPLLPRYTSWFEVAPPHRVVRFEGPFGPPGAPEIVVELMGS